MNPYTERFLEKLNDRVQSSMEPNKDALIDQIVENIVTHAEGTNKCQSQVSIAHQMTDLLYNHIEQL
jgi:phage shock protein A